MSDLSVVVGLAAAGTLAVVVVLCRGVGPVARVVAALAVAASALSYLAWRTVSLIDGVAAMPAQDRTFTLLFYPIEVISLLFLLKFCLLASRSTSARRRREADGHERRLRALPPAAHPAVDVWIPTYDEGWEILERSITAAQGLDWPAERLEVCVLDDGRRPWLQAKCEAIGVTYLTRPDNAHRKAGNLNNALAQRTAPFILAVDADFVMSPGILYRTLGFFADPDVAVVQTPQTYFNIDATRRALGLSRASPLGFDGVDMFYRSMQSMRDAWGVSFFCGTSAVLRREALEAIGGFVTRTDIEDQATSVKLLANGRRTLYLNEVLSQGLAAETLAAHQDQLRRWARGSLQINWTEFGSFGRGLGPIQRLFFLQDDWVSLAFLPLAFTLAPATIWLTGANLFPDAAAFDVMLRPVLLYLVAVIYLQWAQSGLWVWPLSQAMTIYWSVTLLPTVLTTLIKPFGRSLVGIRSVTLKGESTRIGGVVIGSALAIGAMLAVNAGAMLWHLGWGKPLQMHFGETAALLFWSLLNLLMLTLALQACFEPRTAGRELWFAMQRPAEIRFGSVWHAATLTSLSLAGAVVHLPAAEGGSPRRATLALDGLPTLRGRVRSRAAADDGGERIWIEFQGLAPATRQALIRRLYVASGREPVVPRLRLGTLARAAGGRLVS